MEKKTRIQNNKKEEDSGRVNRNCWLANNLNSPPSKRCQYCELKLTDCLFERYLVMSLVLASALLLVSYLVEKSISKSLVASIFVLIIAYGHFFNKSTEKIIVSNFEEKKAKNAFRELSGTLQQKVDEQTKEIKEAYEVEKRAREELQRLSQAKSEFLNMASHQLRTPVSAIKGVTSMMKEGSFDKIPEDKKNDFMDGLYEKALKLEDIISDILKASEMTSVKFRLTAGQAESVDPETLVGEITHEFESKLIERQIELDVDIENGDLPKILCQREFIKYALGNLMENAIKYTPSVKSDKYTRDTKQGDARIKISVYKKDDNMVFEIKDNGIGIPKEEIPFLFRRFHRGSNAKDMYTDGSGLGLFIVREIIEGHGGKVWARSEVDKGSDFFVSLPINPLREVNVEKAIIEEASNKAV